MSAVTRGDECPNLSETVVSASFCAGCDNTQLSKARRAVLHRVLHQNPDIECALCTQTLRCELVFWAWSVTEYALVWICNQRVGGSNPFAGSTKSGTYDRGCAYITPPSESCSKRPTFINAESPFRTANSINKHASLGSSAMLMPGTVNRPSRHTRQAIAISFLAILSWAISVFVA